MSGVLGDVRVLDLTGERGPNAGVMLADLGADVIQVEPPGGSPARRCGPFARDGGRSLFWEAYGRGKRGVSLDLASRAGRAGLLELVRTADVLFESFAPGHMAALGLGYADLAAVNPGLVAASITPFGQDGPKADWPACDLTALAASGSLSVSGDEDRAPLRIAVPQAFLHAGADAAVAALIALRERKHSGLGQHIDVSAQSSAAACTQTMILAPGWNANVMSRMSGGARSGDLRTRFTFPAKDGYVSITFQFGTAMGPSTARLMQWAYEEGFCDQATRDKDWVGYAALLLSGAEPAAELARVTGVVGAFTASKTKAELFEGSMKRGLLLAPIATIAEVRADPQLAAREYWTPAAPGSAVMFPGPFAKFSATTIAYTRPAPALGEHNDEIRAASRAVLREAPQAPGAPRDGAPTNRLPLEGLKILDFSWVVVGPSATRMLADHGATVLKVESATHIDTVRTVGPIKDQVASEERSGPFCSYNAGKLGLALNLRKPAARELVKKLVRWADVLVEAFTPEVMPAWGLAWEDLRAFNPRLVYLSTSLSGKYGPYAGFAGYGNLAAALAGFNNLVSWPDRPPAGPWGAYTDYCASKYIAASILGALEHRDRTGEGQYVDLAQAEAAVHFLTPAFLDYEVNGHVMEPMGDRSLDTAPHGVFRAAGDDRWIALAVAEDGQWPLLCRVIRRPDLAGDVRLASFAGRKANEDEIEAAIEAWTSTTSAEAAQESLVAAGIPAHVVHDLPGAFHDPQLAHRGHFVLVDHPLVGPVPVEASRFRLERTPARVELPGPMLGQHNEHVLVDLLGLSPEEIADLAAEGALE
jgi:crotonobetainyl-CoA:carnitine CoA-transferase CaiB-like acyl-CoA transferase